MGLNIQRPETRPHIDGKGRSLEVWPSEMLHVSVSVAATAAADEANIP